MDHNNYQQLIDNRNAQGLIMICLLGILRFLFSTSHIHNNLIRIDRYIHPLTIFIQLIYVR